MTKNLYQNISSPQNVGVRQKITDFFFPLILLNDVSIVDTRPASISPNGNDDDIPSAPKGGRGPKNNTERPEPSESGDENSSSLSNSEPISGNDPNESSDEDLTTMKRDMIQSKLMSEVNVFSH